MQSEHTRQRSHTWSRLAAHGVSFNKLRRLLVVGAEAGVMGEFLAINHRSTYTVELVTIAIPSESIRWLQAVV